MDASATKSVGTLVHGMNHTVDWRIVRRLASGSVPATIVTLLVISHFNVNSAGSARVISLLLGIMLLLTSVSLIFRSQFVRMMGPLLDRITPGQAARLTVITGVLLGTFVTLSSVGAGAIGVTALLLLYPRIPMPVIVGSDIAHAVPLTLLAGLGHWLMGSIDWGLLLSLLVGSIPGVIVGSLLASWAPDKVLRPVLASTLALVGGKLIF